ncbi:hypothetical protein FEE95_01680 [Maribacter algarum]|uniref:Prenyltransferase n=1 Tax=Maribacter algarum (ex Zhang et al. 2020) TaxID=2578118 RepID=A0A5S3PT88_9FLAO|nr:hypothetical protein [Maribacter algarum]TMM58163.1 hypothetical protein FEE95_01680 [Maribacter algarum]
MRWLKLIFNFYLDASVHVAFAIYALLQVTYQTLNIPSDYHLSIFLFFGSISCYNFIKYGVEAEKYIMVADKYHKGIQFLSFITLSMALYHGFFLSMSTWLGILGLVLLTGLYAIPVLPNTKNLRSWGGLKIFVVAIVWAGATVLLPILSANQYVAWDVGIEIFQRFILVLVLLVPFEIRDLIYDKVELKTVPQRLGITNTKIFGGFATLLFFFSTFLKDDLSNEELILKGILFLTLGWVLFITKRNQSKYFSSFWVEAIPIFWYGMAILLKGYFNVSPEVALSF